MPVSPNHLERQFISPEMNRRWISDMTYICTDQGWLYLAVVLDLFSRAVVGWAMHHLMQQGLMHAALTIAVARRQLQGEALLHSDRGSQYCVYDYQDLLKRNRIVPSHSRPGNCWAPYCAASGTSASHGRCGLVPSPDRHQQRVQHQLRFHASTHRPTHDLA